jgi:hypothetical protein
MKRERRRNGRTGNEAMEGPKWFDGALEGSITENREARAVRRRLRPRFEQKPLNAGEGLRDSQELGWKKSI